MPEAAPEMQEGGSYEWRVVITCNASDENSDRPNTVIFRGGTVQRVSDIEGTVAEQLDYYLDQGIWQEIVTIIAADRLNNPGPAIDEDWAVLMEASGIPEFADIPIVAILESELPAD